MCAITTCTYLYTYVLSNTRIGRGLEPGEFGIDIYIFDTALKLNSVTAEFGIDIYIFDTALKLNSVTAVVQWMNSVFLLLKKYTLVLWFMK